MGGLSGAADLLRRHGWFLGAIVVLPAFVFLAVVGVRAIDREHGLDERGIEVPARVVRVSVDDGSESTTSTVTVSYKPRGDATARIVTDFVYDGDFRHDHPRARREGIRIEYDAAHPDRARLAGESDAAEGWAKAIFGVLGAVASVGYVAWKLTRRWRVTA
jgi:hypothetical protein